MRQFTQEHLLAASQDLIAIESTAARPDELRRAYEYMGNLVVASGANVTIKEFESNGKPSFLAYAAGQQPDCFDTILNTHVDVVPGSPSQFIPSIRGGKLYGRGSYDMKPAGLALAAAFCEYVQRVDRPIAYQLVTDEESAGHDGTLHQIQNGVRGGFVIGGECGRRSGTYEIANEAKGLAIASVAFRGMSTHSAYPWRGNNPALKAARFALSLEDRYPIPTTDTDETTITVTSIAAESGAYTQTPDLATVYVDARYAPRDPNFRTRETYIALLSRLSTEIAGIKIHDFSSPIYTDPQNPRLRELKDAAERIEKVPFKLVRRKGTSDGRFYGDVGNQACEFGIAGEGQHSDLEYITLDAFYKYLKTMRLFVSKLAQA